MTFQRKYKDKEQNKKKQNKYIYITNEFFK